MQIDNIAGSSFQASEKTNFSKWITRVIEEKNIDLEECFEVEGDWGSNCMAYKNIVDAMLTAPISEQKAIKSMILKIDFCNGDIKLYLRHLAQAIAI